MSDAAIEVEMRRTRLKQVFAFLGQFFIASRPVHESQFRSPMSMDRDLIDAFRGGDSLAFEEFVRQGWDSFIRYANQCGADNEGEDVVQEALIRFVSKAQSIAARDPNAYVRGIIRNLCADRHRRAAVVLCQLANDVGSPSSDPLAVVEAAELRQEIVLTLRALKASHREALELWALEDRSNADIGNTLGVTARAAEGIVARGRRRFRSDYLRLVAAEPTASPSRRATAAAAASRMTRQGD